MAAKASKSRNAEDDLEQIQLSLNRALEVDLAIGQLSREFRWLTNDGKDGHPAGQLAPTNRSNDQTLSLWQMVSYTRLEEEIKHLDLLRADLLHTSVLMALEKTVGLPKKED